MRAGGTSRKKGGSKSWQPTESSSPVKNIVVEVKDGTRTTMVEPISIHHLSDLGDGVKAVVDEFVKSNAGAVIPPVSITAVEQPAAPGEARR